MGKQTFPDWTEYFLLGAFLVLVAVFIVLGQQKIETSPFIH